MRDAQRTDLLWKVPVGVLLALVFLGLPVLAVGFLVYQVGQYAPQTSTADGPASLTPAHAPFQGPPEPPVADNAQTIFLPDDAGVSRVALGPVVSEQPPSLVALNDIGRHDGRVCSAVLSAYEQHVLSAGVDGTVRLWRVSTSTELARLKGHSGTVWGAVYAGKVGKGSRVASVGADGTLRLWDLQGGKQLQCIQAHDGAAFALAASPSGARLLSGGADRAVRVWDAATGARVAEYTGHSATVLCVAVSPDGRYALAGCADGSAVTWDLKTGRRHQRMQLGQRVNAVRFLPDGRHALLGGDWSCCYWDVVNGQRLPGPRDNPIRIRSAACLRGGRYALTGGSDGTLSLCTVPQSAVGRPFPEVTRLLLAQAQGTHAGAIHAVDTSADSARAVTAGADGRIRFWQVEAPPYLQVRGLTITTLAVDPAGLHAVSGERDGRLTYWDLERGDALRTLAPHSDGVEAIAFSPDGKSLFSCSPRLRHIQDVARAAGVLSLEQTTPVLLHAAFSADQKWLAGADSSGCCAFDLETGKCAWYARPQSGKIIDVHFLPDRRLLSATDCGDFSVRAAATGELIRTYRLGETCGVSACVPSRDGRRMWIATWSATRGHAVGGWDLEARREVVRFTGLPAEVRRLALAPDGRSLLGAGRRYFHLWGLDPPHSRWHVQTWQADVTEIAYLSNGRQVLVADYQGGLRRWDLPADR
jgi:WD40 repeat protein